MIIKHKKTEAIEQFIGWRIVKYLKIDVLKEKNGFKTAVTTENGKIIKIMDLLFKSTETEINLNEVGCKICVNIKVFFVLFNYLNFIWILVCFILVKWISSVIITAFFPFPSVYSIVIFSDTFVASCNLNNWLYISFK